MVDAKNAFNEKNRYLMLWDVYLVAPGQPLRFHRRQNIIIVLGRPGKMPKLILGKEGGGEW